MTNTVREPDMSAATPERDDGPGLAASILRSSKITLATTHSSGIRDRASARRNIEDVAAGRHAARSSYGGAPGGTVSLAKSLLSGLLQLSKSFSFGVTELAGGSHSQNSRHYAGVASDIGRINGSIVSKSHKDFRRFMQASKRLGAQEVLGPGDAGHDTHVHLGWPRP